jgi:hypothetical protein
MNTLFHVLDDEFALVASILFEHDPKNVLGRMPVLGGRVWLGPPFNKEDKPYTIIEITEEDKEDGKACALRLKPERTLH